MSRTGVIFIGAPAVPEMVVLARRAEQAGFESAWVAETRLTRDAISAVAAIAGATERIRVGTGIVNVYTRNAALLALTFATLEEIAPGRIVMGLGAGSPLVLAPQGVAFERPLTRLREYCDVIPRLIAGEAVSYEGETVRLDGARIEDVLAARGVGAQPRSRIPLYLAATGPRAVEYAAAVADGVLLNVCLPTAYVRERIGRMRAAAERAGRSIADVEVGMCLVVSPHADGRAGRDAAAPFVGDDVVDLLTASGTVADCRRRIEEYRAAGVALPVLAPVDGALELTIEALA